jgi:hypothetical protein
LIALSPVFRRPQCAAGEAPPSPLSARARRSVGYITNGSTRRVQFGMIPLPASAIGIRLSQNPTFSPSRRHEQGFAFWSEKHDGRSSTQDRTLDKRETINLIGSDKVEGTPVYRVTAMGPALGHIGTSRDIARYPRAGDVMEIAMSRLFPTVLISALVLSTAALAQGGGGGAGGAGGAGGGAAGGGGAANSGAGSSGTSSGTANPGSSSTTGSSTNTGSGSTSSNSGINNPSNPSSPSQNQSPPSR